MKPKRLVALLLTVVVGTATALVLVGFAGMSPALAKPPPPPPASDPWVVVVVYTDPVGVSITDLVGNVLGEGVHEGGIRCYQNSNCNGQTELYFTNPSTNNSYEYKAATLLTIDPEEQRAIVTGTGILYKDGRKEGRFSYSATIEDNRDGTIKVTYISSNPGASFIIPNSPGWMRINLN